MVVCLKCGRVIAVGEGRYRVGGGVECSVCTVPIMGSGKEIAVPDEKPKPNKVRAPIVEDTQTVGGVDKTTGAPVIRPKTPDGKADSVTEATDPNERSAE